MLHGAAEQLRKFGVDLLSFCNQIFSACDLPTKFHIILRFDLLIQHLFPCTDARGLDQIKRFVSPIVIATSSSSLATVRLRAHV